MLVTMISPMMLPGDAQPGLSGSKQPMAASVSRHQAKMPAAHSLFACAMRKGSSSGLQRLWSCARATLTDNRRSMASQRLMELMQVKMNSQLLEDQQMTSVTVELLDLLQTGEHVADIVEELQTIEEEEEALQRAQ